MHTSTDAQFDQLQRKLVAMWTFIGSASPGGAVQDENTVLVIPSLTVDIELSGSLQQAYEERFLFMLFLLRQPNIRLIYVTSQPIHRGIVDYYLNLLPGMIASHARGRLVLVSPFDGSSRPLSRKLLERPRLLEQIRSLIPNLERAHIVPFNTTALERELAVRLGLPMYAADPRYFDLGTKSGSRRLFAEEGVPHPLGAENLTSEAELIQAIAWMRTEKPAIAQVLAKLNEGVAGMGNARIDLHGVPSPGDPAEASSLAERVRAMRFELPGERYEAYLARFEQHGGIVEELISGAELQSPSAQLRVTPLGEIQLLSTHDQLLGGPGGQSYLGARFPANPAYGPMIMREAAKVGARLAREGVVGRFALDFVVVRSAEGTWTPSAIEINLRKGGTTHPFLSLQYLTDGAYDAEAGVFHTARGQRKYYVATDHLESPRYRVFTPDDIFDIVVRHHLHFDHTTQTGIVLHMLSGVGDLGRFGFTAIADSPQAADALYDRAVNVVEAEARAAASLSH